MGWVRKKRRSRRGGGGGGFLHSKRLGQTDWTGLIWTDREQCEYDYTPNNWYGCCCCCRCCWPVYYLYIYVYIVFEMEWKFMKGGRTFFCLMIAKIVEYKWSFRSNRSVYLLFPSGKMKGGTSRRRGVTAERTTRLWNCFDCIVDDLTIE